MKITFHLLAEIRKRAKNEGLKRNNPQLAPQAGRATHGLLTNLSQIDMRQTATTGHTLRTAAFTLSSLK